MALLRFELKREHILLLKHLKWSINEDFILNSISDDLEVNGDSPFGGVDIFEDMSLILNGKPDNFDPLEDEQYVRYTDEDKEEMIKLLNELPMALNIILSRESFELGKFKSKWYDINWKKDKKG